MGNGNKFLNLVVRMTAQTSTKGADAAIKYIGIAAIIVALGWSIREIVLSVAQLIPVLN
jgi:hypothetical protein